MPHRSKTRGQIEAQISEALIQFEKDYMGRGPTDARTYLVDNMVIIKLQGVLTPAEIQLSASDASDSGRDLVKKMRHALLQKARPKLEALMLCHAGCQDPMPSFRPQHPQGRTCHHILLESVPSVYVQAERS
jgi:uncharacterized protein YbcI